MTDAIETHLLSEIAPEPPPKGPVVWAKDNLFTSPLNSVLTLIALAIAILGIRGLLGFVFDPARRWDAVTTNMRLLMVQAYPEGQLIRAWLAVGIIAVLLALTFAVYRVGGKISMHRLGRILMAVGGGLVIVGLLGPFSMTGRLGWIITGAVLLGAGYGGRTALGERAKQDTVPVLGLVGVLMALVVAAMWTVRVPVATLEGPKAFERISSTTALPWTILLALAAVAYLGFKAVVGRVDEGQVRKIVVSLWVASFPVIVLVILRDPDIDYSRVFGWFIPLAVAAIVLGGLLLNYLSSQAAGEAGRAIAAALVVVSVGTFFFPMEFIVRFLVISLTVFALGAPVFGGEGPARRRYLITWATWVVLLTYLVVLTTTESTVEVPGNFFIGGLFLTFIIAITAIAASFPIGVVLALGRTSTMPIFRLMSTTYIELIRGVPLITWLLVAFLMLPVALPPGVELGGVVRAIIMIAFFSAAYLAENVRGGLQSIPKGQYEAARALGMSTVQLTVFITLPQALRAVIPALVGQVIALFKDTSLVTIVGLFDFLHIARQVIPTQTQPFNFLGSIKETLLFAAVIYWIFTFTTSRLSLRLEKKLGVGER